MNDKLATITQLFEGKEIRSIWDAEKEDYYFSVVDVVNVLAEPKDARKYWSSLKARLKKEGSEVTTNCSQLKMLAPDGKIIHWLACIYDEHHLNPYRMAVCEN